MTTSLRRPRRIRRIIAAGFFLTLVAPAAPASAGGDCVDAYPQPNWGATVCTPWG